MTRFALAAVLAANLGCAGPTTPSPVRVTGTVTLDGRPLADADADFTRDDGDPPARAAVAGGRFETSLPPGKYRVSIKAYRPATKPVYAPPGMAVDAREQYLHPRYNSPTSLTAEVTAAGPNDLTFDLKSNP